MPKKYIIVITIIIMLIISAFYLGNMFASKIIETTEDQIEEKKVETTYNITKTNEVSKYLPKNINKITIINNLSDENDPTTINIESIEKIEEFMNLIFKTSWNQMGENQINSNFNEAFYQITIIGDTNATINMQGIRRL